MDKREEKTINAIHKAFAKLISDKDYDDITIQDILNESKVSRSTFYSHYKTKNDLLLSISNHIFEHVFSKSLQEERTHDFSKDAFYDYKHLITHIFYHVQDEKELFVGILSSRGNDAFLEEFRSHLDRLVSSYYNNYPNINRDMPLELKKSLVVEEFIVILKYWVKNNFQESPEQISEFFIQEFMR